MKQKLSLLCSTIAFLLLVARGATADPVTNIQVVLFKTGSVTNTGCPGSYTGKTYLTNSAGTMWLTPPTNCTSATLTDLSAFAAPYLSTACASRKMPLASWCATNSVTFPVVGGNSYELLVYVRTAGLTNCTPMTLQVVWK